MRRQSIHEMAAKLVVTMITALSRDCRIADVAISKRPLLFSVWTQLRLRSHQNFNEIFTRKHICQLLRVTRKRSCNSAGNAQAQLHFRDDQQRAFGISNISNCMMLCVMRVIGCLMSDMCHAGGCLMRSNIFVRRFWYEFVKNKRQNKTERAIKQTNRK